MSKTYSSLHKETMSSQYIVPQLSRVYDAAKAIYL
jgi:hypothetical protein